MEDRPVYARIPKNLNSTGGLFGGSVDGRRLLEAGVGLAIAYAIYIVLRMFTNSENVFYIALFIGAGLVAACLFGGNGEPLSVFLLNYINYESRRIFVTLRPPMPDFEKKKKRTEDTSFEARLLRRIRSLSLSRAKGEHNN